MLQVIETFLIIDKNLLSLPNQYHCDTNIQGIYNQGIGLDWPGYSGLSKRRAGYHDMAATLSNTCAEAIVYHPRNSTPEKQSWRISINRPAPNQQKHTKKRELCDNICDVLYAY